MTAITKEQFDAATAKIAEDKPKLDAAKAKLDADTQSLTAAQDAVAQAQTSLSTASVALEAALATKGDDQKAIDALTAEIAANQATIDAFKAQVPPTPTQGSGIDPISGRTMPDKPQLPVGPFTSQGAIKITPKNLKIALNKKQFSAHYICIASNDEDHPGQPVQQLDLQDIMCADGTGSLARFGGMLGASCPINIGRVACMKALKGRYALRFNGMFPQPITIDDLTWIYDPSPSTMTGNIATGLEVGAKQPGEAQGLVHVKRAFIKDIVDGNYLNADGSIHGWAPGDYWNGDGLTTERSLLKFIVDHLTAIHIVDGSIDSKAQENVFGNVFQQLVRGLKIWGNMHLAYHTSINPVTPGTSNGGSSHYRLMGDSSGKAVREHRIDDSWCTPGEVLFRVEGGPVRIIAPKVHYEGTKFRFTTNGGSITSDSVLNGSAFPK